ncbi:MAG TPA: HAD hydrolase-like protein [Candidatus Paceibacterota bacterium]|nr:HAD hydrolase-like protein [Candidatus Paceibacterota bacterium]HMO82825.1 HAD hydrolase-like protein [Candidatus Paceibacterota bacterium]
MKHVIFDYDGVLVDSFNFHLQKVNEIYNIDLTPQEYSDSHDGNFYESKLHKFSKIDFSNYAEIVSKEQSQLPLTSGAKEVLIELSHNHELHLVTSAWQAQIVPFLTRHEILNLFTTRQYADTGKSKHQKLERLLHQTNNHVRNFIFITDTLGDLLEAKQIKLATIAVTFGFHAKDHLQSASPTYFADSFQEIRKIIESN